MSLEVIERDNRAGSVERITRRDRSGGMDAASVENLCGPLSLSESDSALPPSLGLAWQLIEPRQIIGGEAPKMPGDRPISDI
jgi:hypothetical protein